MPLKIALISAFPEGFNPGMLSVDLAFEDVIKNAGLDATIDLYSAEASYAMRQFDGSIRKWHTFQSINELGHYDAIIYWGDFLHWIGYARHDWQRRLAHTMPEKSSDALLDHYYQTMLQPDDDMCGKVILFGGTIYPLSANDLLEDRYASALKRLLSKARLVKFRDMVSASHASLLTGKNTSFMGCDCAFMLNTDDVPPPAHRPAGDYIVYSFGRTGDGKALQEFVRKVGNATGLPVIDMGWLDAARPFPHKLALTKHAKFVITDIYHLSVTALREKKPVFCIGDGCSYSTSTLSDKKKEFLFKQYLANDSYLFYEHVIQPDKFPELMNQIVGLTENRRTQDKIFGMIDASVQQSRNDLINAIQGIQ